MAFNLENMTVDYKKLLSLVPTQRMQLAQSGAINDIIGALTPGQLVNLFPRYYRQQLPDIGQTNRYSAQMDVSLTSALSGAPLASKSAGGVTTYGTTAGKAMTPQEKAVQAAIAEAGLLGTGAVISGTDGIKDGRQQRMKMTYDAFTAAGFSHKQALALTAEVGRENGYQEKYMFGTHSDPYNSATNLGMLSMQGPRLKQLKEHLLQEGRFGPDGELLRDQETMNSMARFYMKEMNSTENTKKTQEFLSNPDIDPERAAYLLGTGYIRWRYDDPRYAHHKEYTEKYYNETENITGQFELAAEKIKSLENVIAKFEPGMIEKLDKRLQDHYKNANAQQQGMIEQAIERIGIDRFNQLMEQQPVNTATLQAVTATPLNDTRFSVLRGNIEEVDPRLQSVIKAASNDLPEGYTVRAISGKDARATGTVNHPNALAMDVQIYDKDGNLIPHNSNSPGWKYYEKLYRSVHIRGKDMYPDEEFIWGGAWISDAAGRGDPMHYQIVNREVSGSSTSSGKYSFESGLDPSHPFVKEGGQLTAEERSLYDESVKSNIKREKELATRIQENAEAIAQGSPVSATENSIETGKINVNSNTAPAMATGGLIDVPPGENVEIRKRDTGEVLAYANDRENIRVEPGELEGSQQMPQQNTQDYEMPMQQQQVNIPRPQAPDTIDPNFGPIMAADTYYTPSSYERATLGATLRPQKNVHFAPSRHT